MGKICHWNNINLQYDGVWWSASGHSGSIEPFFGSLQVTCYCMCFLHVACLCAPDCVTHILPANSYYDCLCQNSILLSPGQENPNDAHVNLYWATCASSRRSHPQQNMWTNGTNDVHPTVNGQNTWNSWGSSYCKRPNGKYETTKDDWIYSLLYLKPKHLQASTRQGTHVRSKNNARSLFRTPTGTESLNYNLVYKPLSEIN